MRPGRSSGGAARVVGALTALVVLAGVVTGPAAPAAAALPAVVTPGDPATQTPETVTFHGVEQTPWVGREDTWQLVVDLAGVPAGATLEATIRDEVETREAYLESLFGIVGDRVVTIPSVDLDDEPATGGRRRVTLAVSLRRDPPLTRQPGWAVVERGLLPGVYPIDLRVVTDDGAEQGREVVHLTRVPTGEEVGADAPPITIAPVVRLGADPDLSQVADTDPEGFAATGVDIADLADDIDGLVTGLARSSLPLTLVPEPESIEALGRSDDGAEAVAALRTASTSRQVVDGPWVDVPVGAWVTAGMSEELTRQRDRGHSVLSSSLGRVDSSTWDATDGITAEAADALWPVGVRTLVLGPGAVEPTTEVPDGPIAVEPTPGRRLDAVVADAGLSAALTRRDDAIFDAAGLAAELALLTADRTGPSGAVIVPPSGWASDPEAVAAVDTVLTDPLSRATPATLAAFLDTVPNRGTRTLAVPPAGPADQLGDHPARLATARAQLSSYTSLVGVADAEVAALDRRLLLSGSRALSLEQRDALVDEVVATTNARFAAVGAPERQTVTLTSSTGDLPLTVVNDLDVPVTVAIELRSEGRVDFRGSQSMTVLLEPGRNRVPVPVRARAPGDSTIDIVIRSNDGVVALDEVRYTVRSSAVSGIGVVLSVGAIAFLLIWWARHWTRSRRERGEGGDGDGGGGGGGRGPDGSDDPDAPTPDDGERRDLDAGDDADRPVLVGAGRT